MGAVAGAVLNNLVAKLAAVIAERSSELGTLEDDVSSLKSELHSIASTIDNLQKGQPSKLQPDTMTVLRELAFDIEDCLDQFLPCAACKGGAVPLGELVDFAVQVKSLKEKLKEASKKMQDYDADVAGQSFSTKAVASTSRPAYVVGIEKPKLEILGLLKSENLKVISIVGFGGSGKTELARAVYGCPEVQEKFDLRAWAVASEHKDGHGLLLAIIRGLFPGEPQDSNFQERLKQTRCLVVLDDIKMHHWEAIESFFSDVTIKLLLTTTLLSVANRCTVKSGYIYNMGTLSDEDSKDLLKKRVTMLDGPSLDLAGGSAAIVQKCHGHPLALISVANYLLKQDPLTLTGEVCHDTSRLLCSHMDENRHDIFKELRRVLVNNYTDLTVDVKTCLLYSSLFPNGRPLSSKTLTSRWLAEGYIADEVERSAQEAANENLKELMDRNIIRPVDASNSGKAKTWKPHGVMHQFMLYKSISSNFIAKSLKDRDNSRHLVIENRTNPVPAARRRNTVTKLLSCFKPSTSKGCGEDLRPRSVTVFGSAEEAIYSDLLRCKLLRVLDLNECNDYLRKRHRKYIYKLLHLKYLTLGKSVSKLEDEMKNLHCLETLDLRKTDIITLPVEVISLPHLAHLFGKIKIKKEGVKKHKNFNLQTLSGVVVDNKSGFPVLMGHMKQLTKVKIWCEITITGSKNYTLLSNAIHEYSNAGLGTPDDPRYLSLHLNDSSKDLLHRHDGLLRTLKLQGRPRQFSEFVKSLSGLKELCLTSVDLKEEDLQALRTLQLLVCLKLVQDSLAGLRINPQDFQSLQRLCLVVKESKFPTIAENALPSLTSIQLLCGGLQVLGGIKIERLKALCEIVLDSAVNQGTIKLWEDRAKKHPKRPKIVLLKRVDPTDTRSSVKYIATDQTSSEP